MGRRRSFRLLEEEHRCMFLSVKILDLVHRDGLPGNFLPLVVEGPTNFSFMAIVGEIRIIEEEESLLDSFPTTLGIFVHLIVGHEGTVDHITKNLNVGAYFCV